MRIKHVRQKSQEKKLKAHLAWKKGNPETNKKMNEADEMICKLCIMWCMAEF